jgi:hypothetical protein
MNYAHIYSHTDDMLIKGLHIRWNRKVITPANGWFSQKQNSRPPIKFKNKLYLKGYQRFPDK